MQTIIVSLIILVALIYVGRKLLAVFRPGSSSCGGCCYGCSESGCSSFPLSQHKETEEK
ncbi:MAG: FeoB-associated Cys-rich membrane protein [Desulfobulbus sp.]|nr:MAG: FeoB-associated Cys-rich membrane protein [Desulfobulbus sp.]RUM38517.1 MAG: FeoB-associated Cys-rich membrane protein [Desulfobulbus sp.]RUM40766.1 MAG: FeoB-associated Cys-rich membrane protein [Desulfobulbus sp.]